MSNVDMEKNGKDQLAEKITNKEALRRVNENRQIRHYLAKETSMDRVARSALGTLKTRHS